MSPTLTVLPATEGDLPLILGFIEDLADYERLRDKCVATEDKLRRTLFGERPQAEVLIARIDGEPAGFALFFHSYSTFLAQHGLYLEDVFVKPWARKSGVGRALMAHVARIAIERDCGRFDWSVLDWNELAIGFYRGLGAVALDDWTTFRLSGDALRSLAAESRERSTS